jgi:transcriptional regulator with XRE-family HTH domain
VHTPFAETLRRLRLERGLSQAQLGSQLYVYRSTIARWESGTRVPDATMIRRLAACLGVDASTLFDLAVEGDERPDVIMVDDNEVILEDGVLTLQEVIPNATVTGFAWPQDAIAHAREIQVTLAFLDIELGGASGLELCHTLHQINPRTNLVFLTAYPDYALDAWRTEAAGFMLKPLTPADVRTQLQRLRFPFFWGGADE